MTVTEPYVALHLTHETADPEEVTAATGVTPTTSGRAGDTTFYPEYASVHPHSSWVLRSRLKGVYEATPHLYDLFEQLEPCWSTVFAISKKWDAGMLCSISCDGYDRAIHLSPDMMSRIAALNADLQI